MRKLSSKTGENGDPASRVKKNKEGSFGLFARDVPSAISICLSACLFFVRERACASRIGSCCDLAAMSSWSEAAASGACTAGHTAIPSFLAFL